RSTLFDRARSCGRARSGRVASISVPQGGRIVLLSPTILRCADVGPGTRGPASSWGRRVCVRVFIRCVSSKSHRRGEPRELMPSFRKLFLPVLIALTLVAIGVVLLMLDGSSSRSHLITSDEIVVEHENDGEARYAGAPQGATHAASRSPSSPHASADAGTREEPQDLPPAPTTLSVIVSDLSRQPLARARVTILRAPG